MKTLTRMTNMISELCGNISMLFATIMTLIVVGNVFGRVLFGRPVSGSYELVELTKGIAVFFSFAYAQKRHSFIHVVMVIKKLPHALSHVFYALGAMLSTSIAVMISVAAFQYGLQCLSTSAATGTLYIPYYPFAFIECLAWALFAFALLVETLKSILAIWNQVYAEEIETNWA